ncbi:MAG: VirB8/TrbF family protein, partial [Stellaceae bacterium]
MRPGDRGPIAQSVRDRESYNWADAPSRYQFVSAMSSPQVRDTYQRWFLQEFNPQTPQIVIGQKGQIDVALKS